MGHMEKLDRRLFAYRDDLADRRLEGRVKADKFVDGAPMQVKAPSLTLRKGPGFDRPQDCELIHGDCLQVFDTRDEWAWVQNRRDGYVGYVPANGLSEDMEEATHTVCALSSLVFPEPNLKLAPLMALPLTATIRIVDTEEKYSRLAGGGWIYNRHVAPLDQYDRDPIAVARLFLNVPYFWGGNTSFGIDCSGLVQIALRRCGHQAPRDTDLQERSIGQEIPFDGDLGKLQTGDLVFWSGHVGFYEGNGRLLHANATDMMVSSGPLSEIRNRILDIEKNDIRSIRRLSQ